MFIIPGEGHQTKETMLSVFMGRGWKLDNVDWIRDVTYGIETHMIG